MKTMINFLLTFLPLLISCSNSDTQPIDLIESETIDIKITPNNSIKIKSKLYFEIITLNEETYASRVQPTSDLVQILDSSTFGYPDALELNDVINENSSRSVDNNFVLGTSVGNAGLFEGNGLKYLGFRILNNGEYQYGWISLINNQGNDCLEIKSYAINLTNEQPILAGQTE